MTFQICFDLKLSAHSKMFFIHKAKTTLMCGCIRIYAAVHQFFTVCNVHKTLGHMAAICETDRERSNNLWRHWECCLQHALLLTNTSTARLRARVSQNRWKTDWAFYPLMSQRRMGCTTRTNTHTHTHTHNSAESSKALESFTLSIFKTGCGGMTAQDKKECSEPRSGSAIWDKIG